MENGDQASAHDAVRVPGGVSDGWDGAAMTALLLPPIAHVEAISLTEMNCALVEWNHKMGPWRRPEFMRPSFHGLFEHGKLIAVTAADQLITASVAGGELTRRDAFELGRVCAVRPDLCRAMVRLWRELVFPAMCRAHGYSWAISYQDAHLHTGDLYRFDGWVRLARSRSGTDARSGMKGRDKWVWGWHTDPKVRSTYRDANLDDVARRVIESRSGAKVYR